MRWVHISELEDPTPLLSGGELLLTTGMELDPDMQREYVARLAATGSRGWGSAPGSRTPTMPEAMVEAADERGFPLFEVPYELPFIAVTEKAFTHLVNEHYAVLRRALSAHERLERIVLSERGLDGVAGGAGLADRRPGAHLRRAAARCSPGASSAAPLRDAAVGELGEELPERARAGGRRVTPRAGSSRGARWPCRSATRTSARRGRRRRGPAPQAWLVAAKAGGPLGVRPPRCTRRSRSWRSSCCAGAWPTTPSAGSPATC